MGNRNANVVVPNQDQNQQLIQPQEPIDVSLLVDQPTIKKVFAIKNPVFLKKETLSLEKDAQEPNIYYIQFVYDSLCDFDLYINLDVVKGDSNNKKSALLPKENKDGYTPAYTPSQNFREMAIKIEKLPKGQNVEFLEKRAFIDIPFWEENKMNGAGYFDVAIEMVPILEDDQSSNEIVFATLCKISTDDNHITIKSQQQHLKSQSMWINIFDVFNTALDSGECLICCLLMRNTIFLPCNHACTCNSCAHSLRMRNNPCPICKQPIEDLLILETDDEKKEQYDAINKV